MKNINQKKKNIGSKLFGLLFLCKIPVSTELEMQNGIELLLINNSIPFVREYYLDSKNTIDFLVCDSVGIECKVNGSAMRVFRQCERYTNFDKIEYLILFTSFHMNLPNLINGKQTKVIKAGLSWL